MQIKYPSPFESTSFADAGLGCAHVTRTLAISAPSSSTMVPLMLPGCTGGVSMPGTCCAWITAGIMNAMMNTSNIVSNDDGRTQCTFVPRQIIGREPVHRLETSFVFFVFLFCNPSWLGLSASQVLRLRPRVVRTHPIHILLL